MSNIRKILKRNFVVLKFCFKKISQDQNWIQNEGISVLLKFTSRQFLIVVLFIMSDNIHDILLWRSMVNYPSVSGTVKADRKKGAICCHPTDPERLPLPKKFYWSSCKRFFLFHVLRFSFFNSFCISLQKC